MKTHYDKYYKFTIERLGSGYRHAISHHSYKIAGQLSRPFSEREVHYIMKEKCKSIYRRAEFLKVLNDLHEFLNTIHNNTIKHLENDIN